MKNISEIESKKFVHLENAEWSKKLDFYIDKINFFQNELAVVLKSNPEDVKTKGRVEDYKKLFDTKTDKIKGFRTRISESEHNFVNAPEKAEIVTIHHKLRADIHEFDDNFEILKNNYMKFIAEHTTPRK